MPCATKRLSPWVVLSIVVWGGCGSPTSGTDAPGGSGGAPPGSAGGASASGGTAPETGGGPATGGATGGAGPTGGDSASGGDAADGGNQGSGGNVAALRTFVYVGSGDWSDAEPGKVTVYELDRAQKALTFVSDHPAGQLASYLAVDTARLRLFAGDEADGGLNSFSIDATTGQLTPLGATAGQNHPVYLSLTPDGEYILAANYNEGSVDVYPIDESGKAEASSGTTSTGAQAHCVVLDDTGHVYVPNKGSSTISLLSFAGGTLTPATPASVALASPRHLFLHGGRAYVVSEEADLITAYDVDDGGGLTHLWDVPRLPAGQGSPTTDTGADVRVTPSGKYLYATNRGSNNTVVAYDLETSPPTLLEHESSLGTTPRNFAIDPEEEFILVANHGANKTLVLFAIEADGRLTPGEQLELDFSPYVVVIAQLP